MQHRQLAGIDEVQDYLLRLSPPKSSGETYTLERMRLLMERLGNPQDTYRIIHVAGTSGKTSTAYFMRSLLHATGCKVGLTASPHIVSVTERVQIGEGPLGDEQFLRYVNDFLAIIAQWPSIKPTYFELLVAFAFYVFAKEKVEYAVVEVGLGGSLDATNVITRSDKVSLITPIGLDHTEVLGDTKEKIARQKAGIILPHSQVIMADQEVAVKKEIETTARRQDATLLVAEHVTVKASLLPPFQQRNLSLALRAYEYIAHRDGLPKLTVAAIHAAMHSTPPGRFEEYAVKGKRIILDGAHNPQKLRGLLEALSDEQSATATWVVGFVQAPEEKLNDCLDILVPRSRHIVATEFTAGQDLKARHSTDAQHVADVGITKGAKIVVDRRPEDALKRALDTSGATVIVTGSLYLVARLRPIVRQMR